MEEISLGLWVVDCNLSHAKATHALEEIHHEFVASFIFILVTCLFVLIDLDHFTLIQQNVLRLDTLRHLYSISAIELSLEQIYPFCSLDVLGRFFSCEGHWREAISA